jgi:hypothetical protein
MPAGEIRARWAWVEAEVWTERRLTALEEGVLGGKWYSLMDKVYPVPSLRKAFESVKANGGGEIIADGIAVSRNGKCLVAPQQVAGELLAKLTNADFECLHFAFTCVQILEGIQKMLAPNQIFLEMVERGKEKVQTRTMGVQAAFEGLSRLSCRVANRHSLSP